MQSEWPQLINLDQPISSSSNSSFVVQFDKKELCLQSSAIRMPLEDAICAGCGFEIRERFLLKVMDEFWHERCLSCSTCHLHLSKNSTCFIKDGHVYCQEDHAQLFSTKCARCSRVLRPTDYVFRCFNDTYHAECFSCIYCSQPLKKGDQYLVVEGQIICRIDYENYICGRNISQSYFDVESDERNQKIPKRPRTILNTLQRKAFKAAFDKSSKPCRKVREQLAKETGLSVRVVQVWFQNQRAKMKKLQRKQDVSKAGCATSSETDTKSMDESKSNGDSDEDLDTDGDEILEPENSLDEKMKCEKEEISSPIDKLYNMQSTYFAFS